MIWIEECKINCCNLGISAPHIHYVFIYLPILSSSGNIPSIINLLKKFTRNGMIIGAEFLIIRMGMSLDFPLSRLVIISLISSSSHSWRYIFVEIEFGKKSKNDFRGWMASSPVERYTLLSVGASETKYLLNSLAISLRQVICSPFTKNDGLIFFLFLPRNSFMIPQTFLLSPLHSFTLVL